MKKKIKKRKDDGSEVQAILGTLGFVMDLGLRETLGAIRYCKHHGKDTSVPAVIWSDKDGWCANCNPFTVLLPKESR